MSPSCWMKLVGFPGDLLSRTTYKKRSPCWAHDRKDPQKQWVTYHCLEVSSLSTCPLLSRALLQRPCTSSIFSKDWESSVMSLEKTSYRANSAHRQDLQNLEVYLKERRGESSTWKFFVQCVQYPKIRGWECLSRDCEDPQKSSQLQPSQN